MTREDTRQEELILVLQAISTVSQRLAHNLTLLSTTTTMKGEAHRHECTQKQQHAYCSQCVYRRFK